MPDSPHDLGVSLLAGGVTARLAGVALVLVLLWGAVGWAVSLA